jgi:DNA phosphorothioation-dependent restriction protein DptH
MSEKQFETFLVEQFISRCKSELKAGFRYQFKSPDGRNSWLLIEALTAKQSGYINDINTLLPYIQLGIVKLIPVLHADNDHGFTENYISRLRDMVASQQGEFERSALLIIHNSMLDTLINSAEDLAQPGKVWHPNTLKDELKKLINPLDEQFAVSETLLGLVYEQIVDNGGTVFGFNKLYGAILDGDLRFDELDLLQDSDLKRYEGQKDQIQKRLEENQRLYERIAQITHRFPGELPEKLGELDFGEKFIEEHFTEPELWRRTLELSACFEEQKKNRKAGLSLETEDKGLTVDLIGRDKAATKAGKRERHLILVLHPGETTADFELVFIGDAIEKEQVEIRDVSADKIKFIGINNAGGKRSRVKFHCLDVTVPVFCFIRLNRENTGERYGFKIVILPASDFPIENIAHSFLVQVKQRRLLLQTDDNELRISDSVTTAPVEQQGQIFSCADIGLVDFESMANESAEINFTIQTNCYSLDFEVEGAVASEALSLPLLLDAERYPRLFDENYFGVFNKSKSKIIMDNQEIAPKGRRLTMLQWEHSLVSEQLLYRHDNAERNLAASDFIHYPALADAYVSLLSLLTKRKCLPSLVGWDTRYIDLVRAVVSAFTVAIDGIADNDILSKQQKQLMQIGFAQFDSAEYITPLHPMVLAYYLYLAEQMLADKQQAQSFADLPRITKERLNPQGLMPFLYHPKNEFCYVQTERENSFWLKLVPQQETSYSYVRKLVAEKATEFQAAFSMLFSCGPKAKLLINSVNNHDNYDLFMGLVDLVKVLKDRVPYIHVCLYDDELMYNEFDRFADMGKHEELKQCYELTKGKAKEYADLVVDLLRTRVTYSKFKNSCVSAQKYAHISFFRNNQRVERSDVDPCKELSGVVSKGLIAGEAAASKQDSYFTAFGLKGVDTTDLPHLRLAQKYNRLVKPAYKANEQHGKAKSTAVAVNDSFRSLLERSYDSSIWTCVIDPKVTLEFFESSKDVVLIHYSDNYTNSTNYDAITLTKQTDLYRKVLERDEKGGHIEEFNAFNGEWLLKMITDSPNERKAKRGIIGAYKYVNCLLAHSDITWVPLSVAEMIRVAGNIGLKISESDFSRTVQGYKQGAISDDVLFAGFKDDKLYLLPVEVKTGKRQTHSKGFLQALELKRYLSEDLLGKQDLAGLLYRGLFARQVLMQVEKYKLYNLYDNDYFDELTANREWWLQGEYQLGELANYPKGFLFVNVEDSVFYNAVYSEDQDILKIELPSAVLGDLIRQPLKIMLTSASSESLYRVPKKYLLQPQIQELASPYHQTDEMGLATEHLSDANKFAVNVPIHSPESLLDQPLVGKDEKKTAEDIVARKKMPRELLESIYQKIAECYLNHNIEVSDPIDEEPFIEGPASILFRIALMPGTDPKNVFSKSQALKLALKLGQEQEIGFGIDKGCVTIDVPKSQEQRYFVDQNDIWPKWHRPLNALEVPLGEDRFGDVVTLNFSSSNCPHLLIGGTTGSGKSEALNTILYGMVEHYSEAELKLMLVDPKGTELNDFERYPHLIGKIGFDDEDALQLLSFAVEEMQARYAKFKAQGVRSLPDYNSKVPKEQQIPWWVLVLDEYADLTSDKDMKKDIEAELRRLAQKARAAGIHLIIATQKPSAEVISTNLRSNLPAQLALRVKNGTESRVILDEQGAEVLNGKGDAYLKSEGKLIRIQCARVSSSSSRM